MTIGEFKSVYPDAKGDLCANCTNSKCKFLYTERKKDLPDGAKCTNVPYQSGERICHMKQVYDCPVFEYKPKKESKKHVVSKEQDEFFYQCYLDMTT